MNTVNITIDGQKVEAKAGQTVLEAATEAGIYIPTLCHHPALKPIGACRICLIEISKHQPLYPACTYAVMEGIAVETRSPRVEKARRFVLDMIFSERNHYCMYCEMSGNCELQDLGYRYGLDHWVYPTYTEPFPVDASRATFLMDHNRCILCRRCVRACSELVANHTLGMRQRGAATMVCADLNVPFGDSSCVECGTCLQVCPTGALIDKRSAFMDMGRNVEVERVKSICSQCAVGCGIEIVVRDGNLIRVEGDWEAAPNGGVLCKKGRFDPLYETRERITQPMIRQGGRLEAVGWGQALEAAAARLGGVPGDRLGVLTSAGASNEALYLVKTLFGEPLGTARTGLLADTLTRVDAPHGSLAQLARSDLILAIGVDPAKHQPVISYLVKRAVDRGTRLIVVDGPANELAPFAVAHIDRVEFDQAVAWAARADAPAVLYGAGLREAEVAGLAGLKQAIFIGLEPGANTRAAQRYGLDGRLDDADLEALYVLLGGQPWEGKLTANGAFLVVQASYASALTERADVVLPAAIWCEQAGTWTNLEGRVQQAHQAVARPGAAKPDWEILALLAGALGRSVPASLEALSQLAAVGLS